MTKPFAATLLALFLVACTQTDIAAPGARAAAWRAQAEATGVASWQPTQSRLRDDQPRGAGCNIETANGQLFEAGTMRVGRAQPLAIGGWVVDEATRRPPGAATLRLQAAGGSAAWELPLQAWVERGDVAAKYEQAPAAYAAGFVVAADISQLPAGEYQLYLSYASGGTDVVCGVGRGLVLTD
jgi:hypothetical protein